MSISVHWNQWKFRRRLSFKHQGRITLSTPQSSKISLSIYRFTIKIYLSVLSHFFYVSSQVFKMLTCSQNVLSIADSKSFFWQLPLHWFTKQKSKKLAFGRSRWRRFLINSWCKLNFLATYFEHMLTMPPQDRNYWKLEFIMAARLPQPGNIHHKNTKDLRVLHGGVVISDLL